ncbi:hypothetical protein BO71DRAFT_434752 [Aspergillus ellipticus CBS 707.79]|uniref:Uncharacterized protein n=1 Tax=Aspergillus ellipticus CBS 707.79 TaxID=1448320 RepID=A0A319CY26_9EURO|nr:hypothetical protein BO71DRAFT_434752 [Aspergillus ellipticus CBS 707.79]
MATEPRNQPPRFTQINPKVRPRVKQKVSLVRRREETPERFVNNGETSRMPDRTPTEEPNGRRPPVPVGPRLAVDPPSRVSLAVFLPGITLVGPSLVLVRRRLQCVARVDRRPFESFWAGKISQNRRTRRKGEQVASARRLLQSR